MTKKRPAPVRLPVPEPADRSGGRAVNRLSRLEDYRLMEYVKANRDRVAASGWPKAAVEATAALQFPVNPWQVRHVWEAHGYPPPPPPGAPPGDPDVPPAAVDVQLARLAARVLVLESRVGRLERGETRKRR